MNHHDQRPTIASVTPTLCALCGVRAPFDGEAPPLQAVLALARETLGGEPVRRCLVFAPDALGDQFAAARPDLVAAVAAIAPLAVPLRSIDPPWTPVCFASMFTGAPPRATASGNTRSRCSPSTPSSTRSFARGAAWPSSRCADSSMDLIFRGRALDYFTEKYDPWVTEKALSLVAADRDDLVMLPPGVRRRHARARPRPSRGARGARNHVEAFADLAAAVEGAWARHPRALVFAPDHGAHPDPSTGGGTHGPPTPADMDLAHCWAVRPGLNPSPS